MKEITIRMRTHHFLVTNITPRSRPCVITFARQLVQYGFSRGGRYPRPALKVFAASTEDRSEFRFHINHWNLFQEHLRMHRLTDAIVEIVDDVIDLYEPLSVELPVKPHWVPRESQPFAIDYLTKPPPPRSKFVDMQTGKGKSFCAMQGMSNVAHRTVGVMKPQFLEKWIDDMYRTYELPVEAYLVVRGSDQLIALLNMAMNNEIDAVVILISNKTMQNYIKLYEEHGRAIVDMGYPCMPDEMWRVLQCGIRLIDEVHMDFHLNFKIDLYSHVHQSYSLSATLENKDQFIMRMYEVAYPMIQRYKGPAYDRYARARAVLYAFREPERIKCRENGSPMYSHNVFEESILKNNRVMAGYIELFNTVLKKEFFEEGFYQKGDKAILYCSSIDMCTAMADYFQKKHPDLVVKRYTGTDPYSNLMESDMVFTTLGSAGTGHDVAGLTFVFLSVAIRASAGNLQGFGRLRKLKDGRTPRFAYAVNEDNLKHMEYHEEKKDLLSSRALTYKQEFYPTLI